MPPLLPPPQPGGRPRPLSARVDVMHVCAENVFRNLRTQTIATQPLAAKNGRSALCNLCSLSMIAIALRPFSPTAPVTDLASPAVRSNGLSPKRSRSTTYVKPTTIYCGPPSLNLPPVVVQAQRWGQGAYFPPRRRLARPSDVRASSISSTCAVWARLNRRANSADESGSPAAASASCTAFVRAARSFGHARLVGSACRAEPEPPRDSEPGGRGSCPRGRGSAREGEAPAREGEAPAEPPRRRLRLGGSLALPIGPPCENSSLSASPSSPLPPPPPRQVPPGRRNLLETPAAASGPDRGLLRQPARRSGPPIAPGFARRSDPPASHRRQTRRRPDRRESA